MIHETLWDVVVYYFIWWLVKIQFLLFWRERVSGRAHIPRRGPVLVVANHLSVADPPAMAMVATRPVWFMGKEELFRMPRLGSIIGRLRCFPVKPDAPDRQALRTAEEHLKRRRMVVIFPEGQISMDGKPQEFRPGAALIAMRNRVPVIPAAVAGTPDVIPPGKLGPVYRRTTVRIVFGPEIPLDDLRAKGTTHPVLLEATARMQAAVRGLLATLP